MGAADCQDCRAGRYGDVCSNCVSGQFRSADDEDPTQCDLCLPGFYSQETGLASCLPCSPGRVAPLSGASLCDYCVVGQFQEGTNELTCKNCDLGLGSSSLSPSSFSFSPSSSNELTGSISVMISLLMFVILNVC